MTDTDLTTLKTPFGLLDKETQEALKADGGPYQFWSGPQGGWREIRGDSGGPSWVSSYVYRVKPQPPKPREFWLVENGTGLTVWRRECTARLHTREPIRLITWPEGAPLPDMPEVQND